MSDGVPLGSGRHHFLRRCPSTSHCPASPPPTAVSARGSHPRSSSATEPPTPPAAILRLPIKKRRLNDALLAAHIDRLRTRLLLTQNPNNLLFREPRQLHRPSPLGDGLCSFLKEFQGTGQRFRPVGSGQQNPAPRGRSGHIAPTEFRNSTLVQRTQ